MAVLIGLDAGTTKSACVVFDSFSRSLLFCKSLAHHAEIAPGIQSPAVHLNVIHALVESIPEELRKKAAAVGVTGQMHGVMLWNEHETSDLYTWQSTVPDLAEIRSVCPGLRHGFGITTLAHLAREGILKRYTHAATLLDVIVRDLTGGTGPAVTDYSNAASWGAFDFTKNAFDRTVTGKLGIPYSLLPQIVPCGRQAGHTDKAHGLPHGIPVMAAIGDNQASVFSASVDPDAELHLTLGTGAQLSAVIEKIVPGVECRPYPGGRYLAVAAPLCGGASWALLQKFFRGTLNAFAPGDTRSDTELYRLMDDLALKEMECGGLPELAPHFLGERNDPSLRGTLSAMDLTNFTPGKLCAAFAFGIVKNLRDSLPENLRKNRSKLLCSGNAIRRGTALQTACRQLFGLPCVFPDGKEEAACGAALLSERLLE